MIQQVYVYGSAVRRVRIDNKELTFLTSELGFQPLKLELDKLDSNKNKKMIKKMKLNKQDIILLKEIAKLGNEKEIANDINKDFKKTGWRLIKQVDGI